MTCPDNRRPIPGALSIEAVERPGLVQRAARGLARTLEAQGKVDEAIEELSPA